MDILPRCTKYILVNDGVLSFTLFEDSWGSANSKYTTSLQTQDKVASAPGYCELSHANQNKNEFVMALISLVDYVI